MQQGDQRAGVCFLGVVQVIGAERDDVVELRDVQPIQGAAVGGIAALEVNLDIRQVVAFAGIFHLGFIHAAEHFNGRAVCHVGVQLADDDRGAAVPAQDQGVLGTAGGAGLGAHGRGVELVISQARELDRVIVF